ncbi:hypothetical protein [Flaviaesturariibacter aridisoli]|uniref:DUF4412 domain-containing protein n=1 Tax=Flaviaesturariibacter aridisoli TaxID=2545761 RepID=A0A4R4DY51_9BACT|nr:hypothetical protein [Flaviaesturariibacter aridisoli]TCZ68379.1 hypothetical protein E0486_13940 [Flaviaesturariibacter aridisoli]
MKRLLLLLLSCYCFSTAFAQGTGPVFEQQLRAILYAPGAEAVTGEYKSETKGSQYVTYYYTSLLPLEGFALRVEDTNGWFQLKATYRSLGAQEALYNNLLATFRKMGPDFTAEIDNSYVGALTSNGTGARPALKLTTKKNSVVWAEFLTDGRVVIDFSLNLETEQSRWDHRIYEKINTEAECLAAMNGLLKKLVGKPFSANGVTLGTITKLEVSASGYEYSLTKKAKAGAKTRPEILSVTYRGIQWKGSDLHKEESAAMDGLTVLVVSLDEPAQITYNDNGKIIREKAEKIEGLAVLQEDKREMTAYLNWLFNQK